MKQKEEINQITESGLISEPTKLQILFSRIAWRPLPPLVCVILFLTTLGVLLQLFNPALFLAWRRDPVALNNGQWWRVITPLFVNDGNPLLHFAVDTIGFLLVGTVTERLFGAVRSLLLLLAGAAVGTLVGYLWDPYGAGSSIALCGLMGGLVIWQIKYRDFHVFSSFYTIGLILLLACEAVVAVWVSDTLVEILIPALICCVGVNLLLLLHRSQPATRLSYFLVGGSTLVSALVLLIMRDIHGAALLAGLVSASLLLWLPSQRLASSL